MANNTSNIPEYYPGKKDTLTNIVDFTARKTPQALYAEFPISSTSYDAGYRKINYKTFANAINGTAWYLHETLGPGKDFETLAYIGPNDMRYNVFVLGAVKAGYKMFYSSPRNSVAAHTHLLEAVECKIILVPNPQPAMIPSILAAFPLKVVKAPSVYELLNKTYPPYPFTKSFEEAKLDPLIVFHTSGSTGLPKPVTWNHDYAAAYFSMIQLDPPPGYESNDRLVQANRVFIMLPPFHGANHLITLCAAIATRTAWIYPLGSTIPSAKVLADGLKHTTADAALIAPPTAVDLAKDPAILEFVSSRLDTMIFAGGDLPQPFGEAISTKMRLVDIYGASEVGNLPSLRPEGAYVREDWHYTHFHPDVGLEFRHLNENLYEMWVVRDPAIEEHQPIFKLFPDLTEYSTCDMYTPHPTKANLWAYGGRSDDIIVFLTGEKTNPTTMEHQIASHPEVKAVLVTGAQKFQAALLIELNDEKELGPSERAVVIERIWPKVQDANQVCPAHAKIAKTHILLVDPKRPMGRAGKGTIQRPLTVAMYAAELEALYADAEKLKLSSRNLEVKPIDGPLTSETVSAILEKLVKVQTGWETIEYSDNFYVVGMDSLQTLLLTRDMKQAFLLPDMAPSTVYINPSIAQLSQAVMDISQQIKQSKEEAEQERKRAISKTLNKKFKVIDDIVATSPTVNGQNEVSSDKQTVILTGSTGSLGSYLLFALLQSPSVSHIHCLNRGPDSQQAQKKRNASSGLPVNLPTDRVSFHTVESAKENFGLEPSTYNNLLQTTTKIFLNGWSVNFNTPLSSFEQQIDSVINFAKFAKQANSHPTIFFVSSISSCRGLSDTTTQIPEEIIKDHSAPIKMGYGESKYVAERLLDYAAEKLHIDTRIARVGQIAGPVVLPGTWSKWEWFPSLVLSSAHIGALPDSLGSGFDKIDWLPIDLLADIIVDLALASQTGEGRKATVFHLHNPNTTTWEELIPHVMNSLSSSASTPLEVVSFKEWLKRASDNAEASDLKIEDLVKLNPAIKLLDTYESLLSQEKLSGFEVAKTVGVSEKLQNVEAIKSGWVEKWCKEWLA